MKFFTRKVGTSLNAQVKVLQTEESRFELVKVLGDEFLGWADNLVDALDFANQHESNFGLSPRRNVR